MYQNYYDSSQFNSNTQFNYNYNNYNSYYYQNNCYSYLNNSISSNNSYNYSEQTQINHSSQLKPKKITKCEFKCQICNSNATGFHYGAYTCAACKLFYLRYLKNKDKYKSNYKCEKKNCQISNDTRSVCSECRFKKCLDVGMNKNRSCFGRHTLSQILRVKLPKRNETILLIDLVNDTIKRVETLNEQMNLSLLAQNDYINALYHLIRLFYKQTIEIIFKLEKLNYNQDDRLLLLLFILFISLFEIKIPQIYLLLNYNQLIIKLNEAIALLEKNIILKEEKFSKQLKIFTFVLVANSLFNHDSIEFTYEKQLLDLIGLELSNSDSSVKCFYLNWINQIYSILSFYF